MPARGGVVVNLELRHYHSDPVTLDRTRIYEQSELSTFTKPQGFWVSVVGEDDWPSWCSTELTVEHTVTLASTATVLHIDNADRLGEFHKQYSVQTDHERRYIDRAGENWPIDWRAVASDHDGIIIAPYQWSVRHSLSWYWGWDVASGCIWNLEAIESVTAHKAVSS